MFWKLSFGLSIYIFRATQYRHLKCDINVFLGSVDTSIVSGKHWNTPEGPVQLLLRAAAARHIDRQQELLEVDGAVAVRVEGAKHVDTKLLGVAGRETLAVNL